MCSSHIRLLGSNSAKLAKIRQNLKLFYRFCCVIHKIVIYLWREILTAMYEIAQTT